MENNNLENNIKRSFEEYSYNLDHDEIWNNIEPKLKRKKKRRFIILWFFGGLTTMGLLYTYTFVNKEQKATVIETIEEAKTDHAIANNIAVNTPSLQNDNIESLAQEDRSLESSPSSQTSLSPNGVIAKATQKTEALQKLVSRNTKVSTQKKETLGEGVSQNLNAGVEFFRTETKSFNVPIPATAENKLLDAKGIKEPVDATVNNNLESQTNKNETQTTVRENDSRIKDNQEKTEHEGTSKEKIKREKIDREKVSKGKEQKEKLKREKERIEKLKKEKERNRKNKEKERKEKLKRDKAKKIALKSSKRKHTWSIQPTIAAIVPLRILGTNASSSELAYRNQRRETETQLEAYSVGFNVQAQTRRDIIFTIGLGMQRLNSRYGFESTTVVEEISEGIISVTEDAQGQIIDTQFALKEKTITTREIVRHFNTHTFINVPIGIGKAWHNRKYDFRFMTGVDINLYHNFTGSISGPDGNDLDFGRNRSFLFNQVFKRQTGFGIWAATEFQKPINNRVNLSIAPRIQLPLTAITQDEYALSQRFINFSLTLGANILINPPKKKKRK